MILLRDMTDIIKNIRKIVLNAINAQKLTDVVYGTVISTNPLKIQVDQKLILEKEQLKLTRAVQDHEIDLIKGKSPTGSYVLKGWEFPKEDKWRYKVKNALEIGDKVAMIRAQGGQQYVVIDKEWMHDDTFTN